MSDYRDALPEEERAAFDEAIAASGPVYAEAIARQDARSPREAAREHLGRHATEEEIAAWIAEFRPSAGRAKPAAQAQAELLAERGGAA